jgi:hypothetical protein
MRHQFGHRSGEGTYINSSFGEAAEIYGSPLIENSYIHSGKVFSGVIKESGMQGDAIFNGGHLIHSVMTDQSLVAGDVYAFNSQLWHNSRLLDRANINGVHLLNEAMVCGTGMVIGYTPESDYKPLVLKEYDFIDRGTWYRRPRTYVVEGGWVVTENVGQLVTVSCTTNTIEKWLGGAGRRYGRFVGMAPETIDEIQGHVEAIRDLKSRPDYDMGQSKVWKKESNYGKGI